MIVRKLISLHKGFSPKSWYIDFAFYEQDGHGNLEWIGDNESAEITEDELYELLKPRLMMRNTDVSMMRRRG